MFIDGEYQKVDCSDLPVDFHALQWNNGSGEVEWKGSPKPENTKITSLDPYQKYITRWNAEKARKEAEYAAMLAAQQLEAANTA